MSHESPPSILVLSPLPSAVITRKLFCSLCGTQEIMLPDYLSIIPIYVASKAVITRFPTYCNAIVTCQRGGVSNKPPGLQAATRHGARDPLVRQLPKNLKKKNGPYIGPVLLRQGEPGTSHFIGRCWDIFRIYFRTPSINVQWQTMPINSSQCRSMPMLLDLELIGIKTGCWLKAQC